MKKHIPNIITLINLFCGCIAIVHVSNSNFLMAFCFVSLGIFFDFFDGFFARLFNVSAPLGLQLDSLADMVTSGVVPGYAMFKMLESFSSENYNQYLPYFGFVITLGACYRLAKFNIDTRQSDSFIGLPTPANALFILSLPLISQSFYDDNLSAIVFNSFVLMFITVLSAFVMNAEIPLFSLKIKGFDFKKYRLQISFVLVSTFLILYFLALGVALTILLYVLLSVLNNLISSKK